MTTVIYHLAEAAGQKNISLSEIARRAQISKSYVSYIARNRIHPSLYMLVQIAEVLEIPVEELYTVERSIS
ncbi:MAG: helix-turn-helix transcriptional regulator [Lachnospiraceae bacterium]|nr:helix-turn-helix transcriptional regulator [Lachnospiraceae bacterium]